jgi:hypothetical protein
MIIAGAIGIDNDRGVLVGWLGVVFLLAEVTRRWRKEWHFLLLVVGAIVFCIVLSFLTEAVIIPLVEKAGGAAAVQSRGMEIFHDIIADILVLVPIVAIIYGIIGAITLFVIRLILLCRKKISAKA